VNVDAVFVLLCCTRPHAPPLSLQALFLQNNVLLFLIYYFQRRSLARTVTLLALLAGCSFLALSGSLSSAAISTLYDFNNLILIASRCYAWVRHTYVAPPDGQPVAVELSVSVGLLLEPGCMLTCLPCPGP
jgi:hypothetical protein